MLGLALGRMRDLSPTDGAGIVDVQSMPDLVAEILQKGEEIRELAVKYAKAEHLFFWAVKALSGCFGRCSKIKNFICPYGRLSGCELKHGPIALINPECPSIFWLKEPSYPPRPLQICRRLKQGKDQ